MTTVQTTTSNSTAAAQRSPWHSPVPYLFGGLAAMLGLIAFALLILACSYWKLSGYLESGDNNSADRDLEAGEGETDGDSKKDQKAPPVFEEKFLVIMAGQEKPTFLATPISSRASSFGSNYSCTSCSTSSTETTAEKPEEEEREAEVVEKSKQVQQQGEEQRQESCDQVQLGNMEDHETANHDQNEHAPVN